MITLIHGDDLAASRNYYKNLQREESEIFDGDKVSKEYIEKVFQSSDLFGNEKEISVENLLSKRKPSKDFDEIIKIINSYNTNATIILWEEKLLSKKLIGLFPLATVKEFLFPKSLFAFLESIQPKNTRTMITLFHKTLQQTESEMILTMLIRQIRLLLCVSDAHTEKTIEELKRLAPWQLKRLTSQANLFSQEKLTKLHSKLFDLEVKSKTGGLPLPLPYTIDFFLSTI